MSKANSYSSTITCRAALAGISSSNVAAVAATSGLAASSPMADDSIVTLWRQWQAIEDRRIDLQAQRDAINENSPELTNTPDVHYATVYQRECAPGEAPEGQKLYYSWEADIDRAWPPNTTVRQARQGATAAVQAWRADMKRRLAEARIQHDAERHRVGLTAIDEELDTIADRQIEIRDEIMEGAAVSTAGIAAKLFMAVQNEPDDHRVFPIVHLPVSEILASVLRDMSPGLPDDLGARVDRLVAIGDGSLKNALTPATVQRTAAPPAIRTAG